MFDVPISRRSAAPLRATVGEDAWQAYASTLRRARERLDDRCLWHVNATAGGGGVAELLGANLAYLVDDGIRTRWLVIEAAPAFFEITKRIHNRLHGDLGDGGPLGRHERDVYRAALAPQLDELRSSVRSGDIVVVHDPQPLGLIPGLIDIGATVVWTCHVGVDVANDIVRSAWSFLTEDLLHAHAATFTRASYTWDGVESLTVRVIPPCIDPLSPKNLELSHLDVASILASVAIIPDGRSEGSGLPVGWLRTIHDRAALTELGPTPSGAPIVAQVSRWDALKDPLGVMEGFATWVVNDGAHLILAGPTPASVADDPEATGVLEQVREAWFALRPDVRQRIHLANLPVRDPTENALVVNALQRRADVVVQKSLAEGFGLTVTEALWKERPVVAARTGGIQEQIDDGRSGLLVDPRDLAAFGSAITDLLHDPVRAEALGAAGRRTVEERFLPTHYLAAYLRLFLDLTGG
jgi:trehalose synthase